MIDSNGLFIPDRLEVYARKAPIPELPVRIPAYKHQEYPKQVLKRADKDDIARALTRHENYDEKRQIMRYTVRPPKIGELISYRDPESDQVVTVNSEDEENTFYAAHPEVLRVTIPRTRQLETVDDGEWEQFQKWKAGRQNALQSAALYPSPEEEKAALTVEGEKLGMQVDRRWNLDRLRSEVATRKAGVAA